MTTIRAQFGFSGLVRSVFRVPRVLVVFCLGLVLPAPPGATAQTTVPLADTRAFETADRFLRQIGSIELADRLARERAAGRISFGRVADNDNAMTAMAGNRAIVLNRNFIQNLEDPKKSFMALAELGATMAHEFEHQNQSTLDWWGSANGEVLGLGNRCERAGWSAGFGQPRSWISVASAKAGNATSDYEKTMWNTSEGGRVCSFQFSGEREGKNLRLQTRPRSCPIAVLICTVAERAWSTASAIWRLSSSNLRACSMFE